MFISIFGHSVFSASVPSSKGPYMFPFSKSFLSLCLSFEKSSLLKISLSAFCVRCNCFRCRSSVSQMQLEGIVQNLKNRIYKYLYFYYKCIVSNNIVVIESLSSMRVVKDLTTILQSINSLMKGFVH